jgi:hypothetical protein
VLLDGGHCHNFVGESRLGAHQSVFPHQDAGLMDFHFISNTEIIGGFLSVYFCEDSFLRVVWGPHDFKIIWGDCGLFLNLFEK